MDRETHTIIFVSKKNSQSRNSIRKQMAKCHQKETSQQRRPKTCIDFCKSSIKRRLHPFKAFKQWAILQIRPLSSLPHAILALCCLSYSLTALQCRKLLLHHGCHIIKLELGKMMRETLVCGFVWREDHAVEQNEVSPRGGLLFDAPRLRACVLLCVGERERVSHGASVTRHQKEHPAPHIYTVTK